MRFDAKAVLLFLLLAPVAAQAARCTECDEPSDGGAVASPAIVTHRVDPAVRKIETSFTNGLSVTVDIRLGQVVFTKANVQTSMTIDQAFMRLANGDRRLADNYIAETLAMMKDPNRVLQFSRLAPSVPGSMGAQRVSDGTTVFPCYLMGYCYYVPRFIDIGGPGNASTYGLGYVDMHRLAPPPHSLDYTMWAKFRSASCADAKDHGAEASIATGGMAGSCAAAGTGVGLALCGLSGLAVVYYANKMAGAAQSCAASYPGPGKW